MDTSMHEDAVRALLALEGLRDAALEDVQRHRSRIRFSLLVLEGLETGRGLQYIERRAFARQILDEHVRRALEFAARVRGEPALAAAA